MIQATKVDVTTSVVKLTGNEAKRNETSERANDR